MDLIKEALSMGFADAGIQTVLRGQSLWKL